MASKDGDRTIVIGLDGADFDLLTPWLEQGELPTLQRLLDEGVSGDLEAVLPPVTAPNWKAYSTGKNPGKLGVYWWRNVDVENERTYIPTQRFDEPTEYWDLLADGEPVGVMGMPTTFPPKSVGSFFISGAPDAEETDFTHPTSLEQDLKDRFDYRVKRQYRLSEGTTEAYREIVDMIDTTFAAAQYLLDRYDVTFLHVTTFHLNALHHTIWDDPHTLEAWRTIDEHLDSFLDSTTNVVVMSDHGMAEIESIFRINEWLQQEGYLSVDTTTSELLYSLGIQTGSLKRLMQQVDRLVPTVDVRSLVEATVPQRLLNHLPNEEGEIGASKHDRIDWAATEALASGQGPLYLVADPGSDRYEAVREELLDRLSELTDDDGRPIADAVYRSEEVYEGPHLDDGPDLVIDQARGIYINEGFGDVATFTETDSRWRAVNARYGVFAGIGPDFTTGGIRDLSILDLAPTILHLHGRAIPADMDGDVRRDVFAKGSDPRDREPVVESPSSVSVSGADRSGRDAVDERLSDLGYL